MWVACGIQIFLVALEENGKVFQWLKVWEKSEAGMRWILNPHELKPVGEDMSNKYSSVCGRHPKIKRRTAMMDERRRHLSLLSGQNMNQPLME